MNEAAPNPKRTRLPRLFEFLAERAGMRAGRREVVASLCATLALRCDVTHAHVRRTAVYAVGLGRALGFPDRDLDALRVAALLHDVGKVAIPDAILHKPGPLTRDEYDLVKLHPITGAEVCEAARFHLPVAPLVRSHHERWDGSGYPDGLRGSQLPRAAQVLALADFYDALREDRPYRAALTREQAVDLVVKAEGSHFDPSLVYVFLRVLPRLEMECESAGLRSYDREQLSARARLVEPGAGYVQQQRLPAER